jgi:hypothetical protein
MSLQFIAQYIREVTRRTAGDRAEDELPWAAYIGVVYAARQLAADALDLAVAPDLAALARELEVWVSDLFRER